MVDSTRALVQGGLKHRVVLWATNVDFFFYEFDNKCDIKTCINVPRLRNVI